MVCKTYKYANGGMVKAPKPKPQPSTLGTGMAAQTGKTLRDKRKEQEKSLGLKNGGMVKKGRC